MMTRDIEVSGAGRRSTFRAGAFAAATLLASLTMGAAHAEPTFSPASPNEVLTPGSALRIDIEPAPPRTSPDTANATTYYERLSSATWTEDNGTIQGSKTLTPTGDFVDVRVPTDAEHCSVLSDSLDVIWERDCVQDGAEFFCRAEESTTTPIRITVNNPLVASPAGTRIAGTPGSTQSLSVQVSGGVSPYQVTSASGTTVSLSNGVISYTIPASATGDFSDTLTINGASSGDACGNNSATVAVNVNLTADPLVLSPSSQNLGEFQPGDTVEATWTLSGGIPGYTAEIVSGPTGAQLSGPGAGGTLTFSYAIPTTAESGTYSATVEVKDSGLGTLQQSATSTLTLSVNAPVGPALSASPSDISLSANSLVNVASTVTKSFSVSGGRAPYVLSVVGVSGGIVGSVAPAQLSAAGSAEYSVDIPASAQSDLAFVNRIRITDALGNATFVAVQANVTASNTLSTLPGLTPNQRSVAQAIETVCPQLASMSQRTAAQEDLLTQCSNMLSNPRAAGIPNTLEQVTNEKATAAKTAGIETGTQQMANVGSRLAALRAGSKGIDFGSLALNMDGESLSGRQLAALASGASGSGASADGTFGKWGFFLNGTVNFGDKDKTANETGFDYSTTGITGGVDYRFTEDLIAGGAFGYATNNVNFDSDDGGLDTETWHLAAYATSYLTERLYLDAIVEYGWNDYDSKRNIDYQITSSLDTVSRQARAAFSGTQFGASLGTGYDINEGPFAYGVYGRVAYLSVDVDSYRETDAGGLNLEMDGFDATSVTSTLGARISRVFNTETAVLVPQARIEWEHEYDNDASALSARFAADPTSTTFLINTDDPDRDYFRISLGLSAVFPKGVSSFINYSTLIDKSDWTDHLIDAGVRWEFY